MYLNHIIINIILTLQDPQEYLLLSKVFHVLLKRKKPCLEDREAGSSREHRIDWHLTFQLIFSALTFCYSPWLLYPMPFEMFIFRMPAKFSWPVFNQSSGKTLREDGRTGWVFPSSSPPGKGRYILLGTCPKCMGWLVVSIQEPKYLLTCTSAFPEEWKRCRCSLTLAFISEPNFSQSLVTALARK